MYKKILFVLLTGITAKTAFVQSVPDSLNARLQAYTREDTVRLQLLNDLAYEYYSSDPSRGVAVAGEALHLATKLNNKKGIALAYRNMGVNYWALSEDSAALQAYLQAVPLYEEMKNESALARSYNGMALVYYNLAEYTRAIQYHEQALEIFNRLRDTKAIANTLNNMGVVYLYLADYPRALETFLQVLRTNGISSMINANAQVNIGLVYKNQKQYEKALEHYRQALDIYRKEVFRSGEAKTYGNIGSAYDLMGNSAEALEYYEKALQINRQIGGKRQIASDLTNIGIVLQGKGEHAKARTCFDEAIVLYSAVNDPSGMCIALLHQSENFAAAGSGLLAHWKMTPAQRNSEVMQLLQQALRLARDNEMTERESEILLVLSDRFEKAGDLSSALRYYKRHILLRDSIYNDEKQKAITRQQLQFDFDKKEMLINEQHRQDQAAAAEEIRRQKQMRNIFAGGILVLALMTAGGYMLYKSRRDAQQHRRDAEFKMLVAETEMKALRAQMNPHFIFNSLNSISRFISINNIHEAGDYLARFAKLMRMILENAAHKTIPLADDLEALECYMQLERIRLKYPFRYHIFIDPAIDAEITLIPSLLLQPLVENSIWHGLSHKEGEGNITVAIKKKGNMLHCSVEDDGVGYTPMNKDMKGGMPSVGMAITESRIHIANKMYNTNGGIEIVHLSPGVRVELTVPLELTD